MSPSPELLAEVEHFFADFVLAFTMFDGAVIAKRYATPYLSLNSKGVLQSFESQEQIGRYFQRVVSEYYQQGCRSCCFKNLEALPLGLNSLLATVTWELLRSDGSVVSAWRESYNLIRTDNGLRIFASTDHAS